jgi:hypothetical protein
VVPWMAAQKHQIVAHSNLVNSNYQFQTAEAIPMVMLGEGAHSLDTFEVAVNSNIVKSAVWSAYGRPGFNPLCGRSSSHGCHIGCKQSIHPPVGGHVPAGHVHAKQGAGLRHTTHGARGGKVGKGGGTEGG